MYSMNDTIVAQCTAPGAGALALIRLSGDRAREYAAAVASCSEALVEARSHTISYGFILSAGREPIDQVLFLVMDAPRTFTGQDVVEITCHNNQFVVQAIIDRLCEVGARVAKPGEFSQRAVLNNKMDLLQAEALHELITAPSEAMARASLAQLKGSLSHAVAEIEQQLVHLAAHLEAHFEFSEEEHMDLDFDRIITDRFSQVLSYFETVLAGASAVQHLKEGVRIALIGSVNAGKSTLLNALAGKDRAIVSAQAGTTRDSIEVGMSSRGYSWTFIDTAGLRQTNDVIEQEGIVRSYRAADEADVVVMVLDASAESSEALAALQADLYERYKEKAVVVVTKADAEKKAEFASHLTALFSSSFDGNVHFVNVHESWGVGELRTALYERVQACYQTVSAPFVLNTRQLALITTAYKQVGEVFESVQKGDQPHEILAHRVHVILEGICELSGHTVSERVMDTVFSTFCIGK
jgi:tRNA modification GTPase